MKKKGVLAILFLGLAILGGTFLFNKKPTASVKDPVYWVLSDNHLIAKSLYDDGAEFERIKSTAAGKELEYQEESLEALVDLALENKPTGIILTGDLTLNGEKKSAEKLAEILEPLKENGIQYFVIPGNHDIYDGWAREFKEDKALRTEQISPKEFETIFAESYKQAKEKDKNSLSYSVEINPDLQFLMLDSNIYGKTEGTSAPITGGKFKEKTLEWIEKQLKAGQENKQESIIFMHHNLLQHNDLINEGYVIDNAEEVRQLFSKYKVQLVFSGHIHSQSIKKDEQLGITEIVSASYSITEQTYGEVSFTDSSIDYQKKSVDVGSWAKKNKLENPNVLNYKEFTKDLFIEDGRKMAYVQLIENGLYEDDPLDKIAFFVGDANWRYFTGNDDLTEEEVAELKKEEGYQLMKDESPFLQNYMDTIINYHEQSNNQLQIKLK